MIASRCGATNRELINGFSIEACIRHIHYSQRISSLFCLPFGLPSLHSSLLASSILKKVPKHARPSKVLRMFKQVSLSNVSGARNGATHSITPQSTIFTRFVAEKKEEKKAVVWIRYSKEWRGNTILRKIGKCLCDVAHCLGIVICYTPHKNLQASLLHHSHLWCPCNKISKGKFRGEDWDIPSVVSDENPWAELICASLSSSFARPMYL